MRNVLWRRKALRWIGLLAPAVAGGCNLIFGIHGGDPLSSSGGGGDGQGISIAPDAATLLARTTLTFTATPGGAITWTVVEPGGGTVTAQGAYTAPTDEGVFHVRATRAGDATAHGEATITVKRSATPAVLVNTGALGTATGHGTQSHLAYAKGTGEWWLFHDPSGVGQLATMHSKDFVDWQPGEQVTLGQGHSGDGRDLAVAYRQINGHDVVHVTQGNGGGASLGRYHIRATLSAGHIAFGAPHGINVGGVSPPDGAATVILSNGLVIDSTGYEPTPKTPPLDPCGNGDVDTYTSAVMDDGTTNFDAVNFGEQVLWCVGSYVNARALLALGDVAVQLYVDGESVPPTNILTNVRSSGGAWSPDEPPGGPRVTPPRVFTTDQSFGLNDWTAAVMNGKVHAVRRVGANFEHRVMSVPGDWAKGGDIPAESTLLDAGLFLAPYGDGLVLVALSADSGSHVRYTAFDGASWSSWATLSDVPSGGSYLSGFAPESGAKPAVIWTQPAGGSFAVAGALLP